MEETGPGVSVVEEVEESVARQILLALSTFRYFFTCEEVEIVYLSACSAVVEEELDEWGREVGGKGQTAYLHLFFPDHLGFFPASEWKGASVSIVTRTSISCLGPVI